MCMYNAYRSFTDLQREHSLFSLSTPSADNDFLIVKKAADGVIDILAKQNGKLFGGQNYKLNAWLSICSTWDAASGLVQVWIDGKPSSRKFTRSGNINGPIIIVLGQVCCLHTIATYTGESASRETHLLYFSTECYMKRSIPFSYCKHDATVCSMLARCKD